MAPARDPPQPGLDFAGDVDKMCSSKAFADFEFDQRNPGYDDE